VASYKTYRLTVSCRCRAVTSLKAKANTAQNQTCKNGAFEADFRKKIGSLAVAGLVVLTTLMNPVNTEKDRQFGRGRSGGSDDANEPG
jgi:hypothetical protein